MTLRKITFLVALSLLAIPAVFAAPPQTKVPGCSAAAADHAAAGRVELIAGTDIFNGELLQTGNDGRLIVQCESVKLALAPGSSMRVFHSDAKTSVELEGGIVAYSTDGRLEDLAIYGLDVKVVPDTAQPALGQVDVSSHCAVSVESTKSSAAVRSGEETRIVEQAKAYNVTPVFGVDYSEDWRPIPADYPDFPREAKYHESHHHVACATAADVPNAPVKSPFLTASQFHQIVGIGVGTGVGIWLYHKYSESPSKPNGE